MPLMSQWRGKRFFINYWRKIIILRFALDNLAQPYIPMKKGGMREKGSNLVDFKNFINENELLGLDLIRVDHMWNNMQNDEDLIQSKLDWALWSTNWMLKLYYFLADKIKVASDHTLILQ